MQDALQNGLEFGSLDYAGYCVNNYCNYLFWTGGLLESLGNKQLLYMNLSKKNGNAYISMEINVLRQLNLNLQGLATDKYRLIGEAIDEVTLLPQLQAANNGWAIFHLYLHKGILLYLLKDGAGAVANISQALEYVKSIMGVMSVAVHNFYYSLALLAVYSTADTQAEYLQQVEANQEKMQDWAFHAPMNYLHKYELVEAEKARVLGEKERAMDFYDRAIHNAAAQGYIQEEALANELAAEYYLSLGREKVAKTYMTDAYYGYIRWGANAKVADLEERYPQLIVRMPESESLTSSDRPTITMISTAATGAEKSLDFATVIKASIAISDEIVLDALL